MKINAVGINAYRQATEQIRPDHRTQDRAEVTTAKTAEEKAVKLSFPSAESRPGSKLAVKLANADFVQYLSDEEKKALQMVFEKFGDGSALKPGETLGRFVDVKI